MTEPIDISAVLSYLRDLQDRICDALAAEDDGNGFREDAWDRPEGGGGRSRVIEDGGVFEKAGVNFSHVHGDRLPPSATASSAFKPLASSSPNIATRLPNVVGWAATL